MSVFMSNELRKLKNKKKKLKAEKKLLEKELSKVEQKALHDLEDIVIEEYKKTTGNNLNKEEAAIIAKQIHNSASTNHSINMTEIIKESMDMLEKQEHNIKKEIKLAKEDLIKAYTSLENLTKK